MSVKWKKTGRFKPEIILKRVAEARTLKPKGGASFNGFAIHEYLPILQSMLAFPPAASGTDISTLVWRSLSRSGPKLEPRSFLEAVNAELSQRLATREETYRVLTSLSLLPKGLPKSFRALESHVNILPGTYSRRFAKARDALLKKHRIEALPTPESYCKVVVGVRAKSPSAAFHKGGYVLDLVRAILCLMSNKTMEFTFFGPTPSKPLNAIRTGSVHTLHHTDGSAVGSSIWYEPGFIAAPLYEFKESKVVVKNLRWAIRRIENSSYGTALATSLVRFVRALDERDPDVAFLRLWGALEALLTPEYADYEKLVSRCAFLFSDVAYHTQVLEHLREYRNVSVHAGEQSGLARTHCYQLQMYYVTAAWFHVRHATYFSSHQESLGFLDCPASGDELKRRIKLLRKAVKFTAPSSA